MTTILSRKLLPHQTDQFILVKREDAIYQRVDSEYITKRYFTTQEVCDMLEITPWIVRKMYVKLGMKPPSKGFKMRFTIQQVRKMIQLL